MPRKETENCFVSPERGVIIDMIASDGLSWINSRSLDDFKAEYPDVQIMSTEDASNSFAESYVSAATEITEQEFQDALEVLPPSRWKNHGDTESFYSPEFIYSLVTTHYVRIQARYYTFQDRCSVSHEDAVRKAMFAHTQN